MGQQKNPSWKSRAIIQDIPIEFFSKFKEEPIKSALEYMSITRGSRNPFIRDHNKIQDAIKRGAYYRNPINEETYSFDPKFVATDRMPRYVHVDLSINGDAVGISMCHAHSFVESVVTFPGEVDPRRAKVPNIKFDFVARLKQRLDMGEKELNYRAIVNLLINLEERHKFNLREGLITFDRFQSHMMMQMLREIGFHAALLSIDHTQSAVRINDSKEEGVERISLRKQPAAAMISLKECLNNDRIEFPDGMSTHDDRETWVEKEARESTWVQTTQKVEKMEGGSDDVWQSIAGAVFNCMNNAVDWGAPMDGPKTSFERSIERMEEDFYRGVGRGIAGDGMDAVGTEDDFYDRVEIARGRPY